MKKELQSKDFRTGNYVITTVGNGLYTVDPFIIKCLYYDGNNQNSHQFNEKLIEAIPLTEEWLINFGFKQVVLKTRNYWTNKVIEIRKGNKRDGYAFYLCHYHYMSLKKIDFVHELQNLYFALTGEELTFKSE